MNLTDAKKHAIKNHPFGHLTIAELKKIAKKKYVFVYGDKAQILQCFAQHEQMTKLYDVCWHKRE